MNSLLLGGICGTTQTWWSTRQRQKWCGLPTCLSPLKQCWSGPWTKTSSIVGRTTHASLPLHRPYYALLSCKNIAKGKTIQAYYGPASGFLLGQYVNEKFLCWITEFIEGTSNISSSVYCQLLTESSFLISTCSKNQTSILIMTARLSILTFKRNKKLWIIYSYTLLGQAVPIAILEKHWWRSNNKAAV